MNHPIHHHHVLEVDEVVKSQKKIMIISPLHHPPNHIVLIDLEAVHPKKNKFMEPSIDSITTTPRRSTRNHSSRSKIEDIDSDEDDDDDMDSVYNGITNSSQKKIKIKSKSNSPKYSWFNDDDSSSSI
eukprot:94294_1